MKYLRTYEDISNKPKEGDYVLMRINLLKTNTLTYQLQLEEYISNNFGQIDSINFWTDEVTVKYFNIPEEIKNWFQPPSPACRRSRYRKFNIDRIVEFAPTEEDLKLKIAAKKYNL